MKHPQKNQASARPEARALHGQSHQKNNQRTPNPDQMDEEPPKPHGKGVDNSKDNPNRWTPA